MLNEVLDDLILDLYSPEEQSTRGRSARSPNLSDKNLDKPAPVYNGDLAHHWHDPLHAELTRELHDLRQAPSKFGALLGELSEPSIFLKRDHDV